MRDMGWTGEIKWSCFGSGQNRDMPSTIESFIDTLPKSAVKLPDLSVGSTSRQESEKRREGQKHKDHWSIDEKNRIPIIDMDNSFYAVRGDETLILLGWYYESNPCKNYHMLWVLKKHKEPERKTLSFKAKREILDKIQYDGMAGEIFCGVRK